MGYTCTICGEHHDTLMLDARARRPEAWLRVPEEERSRRTVDGGDFATVEVAPGDWRHFVRSLVELPVPALDDRFAWGVWVELAEPDARAAAELYFDDEALAAGGRTRYTGRLATELPAYPRTEGLEGTVQLRPGNLVPAFVLEPSHHPLAVEQRAGITVERVQEFARPHVHA